MARPTLPENNCRLVKGENGLVLRGHMMAQVEWLETLFLQSMAARPATERSQAGLANLHFVGCWIKSLPAALEPVATRLMQGERVLGDIPRIRSAIIADNEELSKLDHAFVLGAMYPAWFAIGPLVTHQSLNTDVVLKHFGRTVAGAQSGSAFWLLLEFLWPFIEPAYQAGLKYYAIEQSGAGDCETRQALFAAVFTSIFACSLPGARLASPDQAIPAAYFHLLLRTIREQFLMMLGILGRVGERSSGYADIGPELAAIRDSLDSAEAFHAEWERTLQFEDGFYGFHVVPNVGWADMERYLRLCYRRDETARKTLGYREAIRWEVCSFMMHQAKVATNLIRVLAPEKAAEEYEKAVSKVFRPLISGSARKVARARWYGESRQEPFRKYLPSAELEALEVFRTAYREFRFSFKEMAEDPLNRPYGLLRQSGEHAWRVAPLFSDALDDSSAKPAKEISFPRYAERVLDLWVSAEMRKARPAADVLVPDTERLEGISATGLQSADAWDGAIMAGPDGERYVTIVQLARRLRCPEHQLRVFDDALEVRRVSDVFGEDLPSIGRKKLQRNTRLYRVTPDLVHLASHLLGRIGTARPHCKTEGITRAELCRKHNIPLHKVLYREKTGDLEPIRDASHVIYPPDQEELAVRLTS